MTKSLLWIGAEINKIPSFHGLTDIQDFLTQFEEKIPHEQRIALLRREIPMAWGTTTDS